MRVGVIGAGFQGACVALELALRGLKVELFDCAEQPITKAGFVNEGKIHLGFTYAKDPSLATAKKMLKGALLFRSSLNRWIDLDALLPEIMTGPCRYVVHVDGQLPFDRVWAYHEEVAGLLASARDSGEGDYLGLSHDATCHRLTDQEASRHFDMRRIAGVIETPERSLDVKPVARTLRAALEGNENIAFHPATRVNRIRREGNSLEVGTAQETHVFDHVVNAAWSGRLAIDAGLGLRPAAPVVHRFKFGVWIKSAKLARELGHFSIVQGPYGDVVPFPNGTVYLSWYPVCMTGFSNALEPPDWPVVAGAEQKTEIANQTIEALSAFCPPVRRLGEKAAGAHVEGGVITAWGREDIDRPASRLHQRKDSAVHTHNGNYHSVDTGKYTHAPGFALEVADRICAVV